MREIDIRTLLYHLQKKPRVFVIHPREVVRPSCNRWAVGRMICPNIESFLAHPKGRRCKRCTEIASRNEGETE